jgi:hypothetical protein
MIHRIRMVKNSIDTITPNRKNKKKLSVEDEGLSKSLISKIKAILTLRK